jgi:hypothetical protein
MMVLQVMGDALGLVLGSLVAAALFCWLCWSAFKLVHHPELGVPFCLALAVWAGGSIFAASPFLRLAGVYAALVAVALWPLGIAWRRQHDFPHVKHVKKER